MTDQVSYGALAVPSRRRILEVLRSARTPLDVVSLAGETGLHPNTVRFHLDVLADAGYVRRTQRPRGGPGRPQAVYVSSTPAPASDRYQLLAEILAAHLDRPSVAPPAALAAQQAGRAWLASAPSIRSLDAAAPDRSTADPSTAGASTRDAEASAAGRVERIARRATALFTELGFDPVRAGTPQGQRIELRSCPFLDLARRYPGVVCEVHRGLLGGIADQVAPDGAVPVGLVPFASPGVCVATVSAS
ncbi:helix-turn-helix domain-containing protein [Micromonospora sp. WMMD812]|uniref:helix-turn-helix transcriptional regulator n=1 Tax=Micromonospora sp. WMMD812 TaxID=3015152 RepID=UPI00248B0868|nr:helix-turn-helix domain-containing protein [Micromonospora sp. WMMD812]WBB67693.1 helix-turn-helix domain-containing protein [Micromonospora sp. WMMD812]